MIRCLALRESILAEKAIDDFLLHTDKRRLKRSVPRPREGRSAAYRLETTSSMQSNFSLVLLSFNLEATESLLEIDGLSNPICLLDRSPGLCVVFAFVCTDR